MHLSKREEHYLYLQRIFPFLKTLTSTPLISFLIIYFFSCIIKNPTSKLFVLSFVFVPIGRFFKRLKTKNNRSSYLWLVRQETGPKINGFIFIYFGFFVFGFAWVRLFSHPVRIQLTKSLLVFCYCLTWLYHLSFGRMHHRA